MNRRHARFALVLVPTLAVLIAPGVIVAADDEAGPVVVTATRLGGERFQQPYAIYGVDAGDLGTSSARTANNELHLTPGVHVQRTSQAQASPYIRGLTGEQTLLLFDGVRYNHAMNRPGANQYAALIPAESIGRIDTILGSTSAVAGSDGLTGALDYRLAEAGRGVDKPVSPWIAARYGVAEDGVRVGGGVDGRVGDVAYSIDGSFSDFGDITGGEDAGDHLFGDAAGDDEIPHTGYDEYHYAGRVAWLGLARNRFELSAGQTRQTDAPRPDGYFENSGNPTRLSREYDVQEFDYAHLRHVIALDGAIDRIQTTGYFHRQHEEQTREDYNPADAAPLVPVRYRRREYDDTVDTVGIDLQLTSIVATHEITYGGTAFLDTIDTDMQRFRSPGGNLDPNAATPDQSGSANPGQTTVPDDAEYLGLGVFLQDSWQIDDHWNLLGGVRYSRYAWDFTVTDDRNGFNFISPAAADPNAGLDVDESVDAFTANVRLGWTPTPDWLAFVGVGQGFRAPNISNLAGIQDRGSSSSGVGPQITGNLALDPETSITYEIGARWRSGRDEAAASAFVTTLDDLIQVSYTDLDGNGAITATDRAELVNGEDGMIVGFEVMNDLTIPTGDLLPVGWRLAFVQSTSLTSGEVDVPQLNGDAVEENISRANLAFGRAGLLLEFTRGWWARSQIRWQDRYDEVAPGDATDTRHTTFPAKGEPAGAMPGYVAWDAHAGWRAPKERFWATGGIENMLDHSYRPVGSGNDAVGFNFVLAGGARF
ncbi:MAG TPA: TonB-dependent receptor [Planctomycetota bacterium]|nr:TonB-dependent receptor [Planctomycetota bacterium]